MNRQLHCWKQPAYFPAKLSIPVNYLEYLRPHFLLDTLSKSRARSASTTMIFPFWEIAASMTPLDLILWAVAWLQPKSLLMPNRPYTYRFSLDGFVLALPSLPSLANPSFNASIRSPKVAWKRGLSETCGIQGYWVGRWQRVCWLRQDIRGHFQGAADGTQAFSQEAWKGILKIRGGK